ncbi:PREDICTED: protein FAM76A-like [Priapulus caudatus]|uniref:Protein FAM76A-like n=1 Tax=Priapulus caudatus TaxID=37621 RepID=A0ABM1F5W2_PRICU|nr:PREDICTED: protein FAM76A-like [Priapulus caudatus]
MSHKVDGKLLCWLCMLSYKRVLAKAKKHDDFSFAKRPAREGATGSSTTREKPSTLSAAAHKAKHRRGNQEKSRGEAGQAASKKPRLEATIPSSSMDSFIDPNSSEHLIATTQLKEQITALKRQLDAKSKELLERDKKVGKLKNREMNKSNTTLQKQLKEKQTLERRSTNNATKNSSGGALSAATLNNSADSGGSNTNSPMMSS